jgi:hypothetical protein
MRTIDATLKDGLANQKGAVIARVLTWADATAYNAAPTVPEHTWITTKYDIFSTSANAELVTANDYTVSDFTVFIIERGLDILGNEYTIQSGLFFVKTYNESYGRIKLTGSSYPNQKISIAGDGTYQTVIEAFCTAIGKTAVFKVTTDPWLDYQFLPTGKTLSLNKAEQFENLLKQKYTIMVYEESPNNLVFYNLDSYAIKQIATIVWSPELAMFCGVNRAQNTVTTSTDGTLWTNEIATESNQWYAVAWSPTLNLFAAVSADGTNRVMTSPDGITWTSRTAAEANTWVSVAWSPELGLFCAVSIDGTNRVMTSPDGITWTSRTAAAANLWRAITWSPSLGLFCAVSYSGVSRVMTSPDGITWTSRTAAEANTWLAITWSPELGLLCAVSADGTNRVMTSPDGITWTSRTAAEANTWLSIAWSPTLNLFAAGSQDGANQIMTSPDGITWTSRITNNADFSLAYTDGPVSYIDREQSEVHFLWRDEAATLHTSGDTSLPQWNLGFLSSADNPPTTKQDAYYKIFLQKAPIRLDITDSDKIHFTPYWSVDPTQTIDAMMHISEHLDIDKSPAWYQEIKSIVLFNKTEGGALPSTIERVAAYTPLVSTGFDGNLTPAINNLQAFAQAVDDLSIAGATTEDIQDIIGAMVTGNTETGITVTYQDSDGTLDFDAQTAGDARYAPIAKGVTNGDSHDHSGGDGAQINFTTLSNPPIAETNANDIFNVASPGGVSAFVGTIATLPGGAVLTYNVSSGQEGAMVPVSTSQLGKMRLYNTTRGTSALISNCVVGTNTITLTANVPSGWATTDVITIASQTVSGGGQSWVDIEITSGPTSKTSLFINTQLAGTTGDTMRIHPFTASFSTSKYNALNVFNTAAISIGFGLIPITSNVFSLAWSTTITALVIREAGYIQ